jgi:hypothetical protein
MWNFELTLTHLTTASVRNSVYGTITHTAKMRNFEVICVKSCPATTIQRPRGREKTQVPLILDLGTRYGWVSGQRHALAAIYLWERYSLDRRLGRSQELLWI